MVSTPNAKGRGGARNTASRLTTALSPKQVDNLIKAKEHATAIGLPFTRFITIHWQAAGLALKEIIRATGRFIELLTKKMARHGSKVAWLWVHENGEGKGAHVHILAHIPPLMVSLVARQQMTWLKNITGKPYRKGVIHSRPIGSHIGLERGNPDLHALNLETVLEYVLKGLDDDAAAKFGLERREPGGKIIGKRCGTSQNISAKARLNFNSTPNEATTWATKPIQNPPRTLRSSLAAQRMKPKRQAWQGHC